MIQRECLIQQKNKYITKYVSDSQVSMPEDGQGKALKKWNKVSSLGLAWALSHLNATHFSVLLSCFHCQFKLKSSWTYFV